MVEAYAVSVSGHRQGTGTQAPGHGPRPLSEYDRSA
jgi:hypothetical protein